MRGLMKTSEETQARVVQRQDYVAKTCPTKHVGRLGYATFHPTTNVGQLVSAQKKRLTKRQTSPLITQNFLLNSSPGQLAKRE